MNDTSFLIANLDVNGFYRINYDTDNWNKIIYQLSINKEVIPVKIRSQLISDGKII